MESINHYSHFLIITLIFFTTFTTTCSNTTTTTITNNITSSSSSSPTPPMSLQELNNILDALIGSGDTNINKWVSILSMSNPLLSLTLFIPQQQQQTSSLDPFTFPYHIIPQRLSFADLLLIPRNSRLPTLLPDKTIILTDNSSDSFTLDDVRLTHPDLYSTSSLAVHGVETLLDYSRFGDATGSANSPPFLPVGETWNSAASLSSSAFNFLLVFCFLVHQVIFFV